MHTRELIPGERHHWWPKSVSQHWVNEDGQIGRVDPEGTRSWSSPTKTARIADAHNFRMDWPWSYTFEQIFDRADNDFPAIIALIQRLAKVHKDWASAQSEFLCHDVSNKEYSDLLQCMLSLLVRSPRFRASIVSFIDSIRSNFPKTNHKPLTAANLQNTYLELSRQLQPKGKLVILWSDSSEFLYGDGLYSSLTCTTTNWFAFRALVPITPNTAVLHVIPNEYQREPNFLTFKADPNIVQVVNETVQAYSKDCLFFRSTPPKLEQFFLDRTHYIYDDGDPIQGLIDIIPGVLST